MNHRSGPSPLRRTVGLLALLAVACAPSDGTDPDTDTTADSDTDAGGQPLTSAALAINDDGLAVGWVTDDHGDAHAAAFSSAAAQTYTVTVVPTPDDGAATGAQLTDSGKVAGQFTGSGGATHAFYFDGATATDLGAVDGDQGSAATGLTDDGTVVGESWEGEDTSGVVHGWFWTATHGLTVAPTPEDADRASLAAINGLGLAVGNYRPVGSGYDLLYTLAADHMTTVDLSAEGGPIAYAHAINDAGLVVFTRAVSGAGTVDSATGDEVDLPSINGFSFGLGLNQGGDIVGSDRNGPDYGAGQERAVRWSDGAEQELGVYGDNNVALLDVRISPADQALYTPTKAVSVNTSGQILCDTAEGVVVILTPGG